MTSPTASSPVPHHRQDRLARPKYYPAASIQQTATSTPATNRRTIWHSFASPSHSHSSLAAAASPSSFPTSGLVAPPSSLRKPAPRSSLGGLLASSQPSAYESFDEIGWVVDLSSRIKSALLDDTTRNPSSPGSSYEPVPGSAKRRPRLSRPSRDFREIEQKVKRRRAQSNTGDCQPPPEDDPFTSNGAGPNGSEANGAYHKGKTMAIDASEKNWNEAWAKNAQREFEQRREAKVEAIEMAKAEKSQGKKRHGGSKSLSSSSSSASSSSSSTSSDEEEDEEEEEEEGSGAEQARTDVDPAVERSHLTAQSIRELLANGGVTTEGEENIDLGELLDSARPVLPGGQPPSSLFEAFKKDDGALDIGEILNHRARLSSEQAGAAASASAGPTNLKLTLPPADSGGKEQDGRKRPLIQEVNEIPEMDAEGESESEDSSEDELKSERAVKLKPLAHDETAAGSENGESRDSSDGVGSGDESQEEEGAEEDDVDNDDDLDEESDDNEEEEEEEEEEVMRPKRYSGNEGADASEPIVLSSSDEDEEDHDEVAEDSEDEEAESLQGAGMEDDDRDEDEDEEKEEDEEEEEGQGHGDSFEYDEDHEGDSLSRRAAAAAAAAKAGREFLDSYKAEDDEFNFEDEFEGEDVDDDGLDDESEEEEEEEDEGDHDHLRRHSHDGSSHLDLEETDDNRNVVEPVGQNRPSTVQAESTSVDRNKQFSSFTSASQLFYSQDGFQHRDSRENLAIDQRAPQPLKSEQASGKLFEGADFASIDPQLLGNILQNVQATQPSSSSSSSMQGIMDTARLAVPASEPSNLVPSAPAFFNESFDQSFSQLLEGDLADTVASAETREPVGQDIIKMVDENPVEIPSELPMLEVMGQEEIGSGRSIGSTASKGDEDESLAKQPPVETQALSGQLAPIFEQATQVQVEALSSGTDAAVEIPSQIKGPENLALFRMKTGQLDPPTPSVASVAGSLDGNATPVVPSTPGHSAETGHHINIESEALESSVDLVEGDAMPTLKGELSTEESSHPVPSIDALVELRKATGALDSPALSLKSEKGSAVAATMHSALPEAPLEEVREGKVDLEMVSPQQANTEDAPHPAPTVEALVALREQVGTLDSPASLSTRSISSGTEIISAKPLKGEEEARKEAGKQENDQDMKAGNESQSDAATRVVPASDEGPPSARDTVNPTRVSEEAIRIDIGEEVALVAGGEEDKEAQTVEGTGEGREARGEEDIEKEEAEDERAMRGVNAEVIFPKDADDAAEPKRESEMNAESVNAEPLDNRGTRNSTEVDAEDGDEDEERELEDEVRSIFRPKSPTPESSTLSHQEPTIAEIGNHAETSVEKQTVAEAGTQQEGVDHLKGRSLRSLKKEYKQVLAQIETKKEAVQSQSGKDDEETKARSRGDLRPRSMAQPSSSEGSGPLPVTPNQGVIPLPGRPSTLPMSAILRDRHRHQHGVKRTPYSSAVVSTPMSVYSTSSALTELSEEGEAESAIQALSPRVEIRASQTEMPLETTTSGDHKIEKPEEDDDRGEGGQGEEEEEGQPAGNRGPSTRSQ
ncbi:hypothetical protein IE53DRAFT_366342 [Violaceomyces palustris]|uniref:Uncharacterized protein n=1 Tax=Violaceomyces palustris TaxID=1673888 RepID=A0ACD0P633_9BASI|nr:hypothetical protein IE53DRAFT_366342 [Violaceomyces palustris]